MSKLRYFYGTMNSMKSSTLLMKAHQFSQNGCNVILIKPRFDTRDKEIIKSRALTDSKSCLLFSQEDNVSSVVLNYISVHKKNIILCDEVQFATPEHIDQLWNLSKMCDIDVYTFGLKTSYQNNLFKSIERLLVKADTIEEIKSMCSKCDNKATTHLRYIGDKPVFKGIDSIVGDLNGEERYESVCQECWFKTRYY